MRVAMSVLGCVMFGSVLFAVSGASGAGMPAGGPVSIFVTPSPDGIHGPIVITGAIGDHGQTTSIDKNGKPDANGNFVRITLKKGTFEVDSTALNAKTAHAQPSVNKTTCTFDFTGTGPVHAVQRHRSLQGDQRNVEDHDHLRGGRPRLQHGRAQGAVQLQRKRRIGCPVLGDQRKGRRQVLVGEEACSGDSDRRSLSSAKITAAIANANMKTSPRTSTPPYPCRETSTNGYGYQWVALPRTRV